MSDLLISILAVCGIIGVAIVLIRLKNSNPDEKLTDLILNQFRNDFSGWLLVILLIATVGECLVAATTHLAGAKVEINPIARIMTHIILGFYQFVSGMIIASTMAAIYDSFIKSKFGTMLINVIIMGVSFLGLFLPPYFNLTIMAAGLGEIPHLGLFYSWISPFTNKQEYVQECLQMGLRVYTSPWAILAAPIILMIATIVVHYLILVVEIFYSLGTNSENYMKDDKGQQSTTPASSGDDKPKNPDKDKSVVLNLLKYIGITDKTKTDKIYAEVVEAKDRYSSSDDEAEKESAIKLMLTFAEISNRINEGKKPEVDAVRALFEDSILDGGLGIVLPN
jgi:hypothetical protein